MQLQSRTRMCFKCLSVGSRCCAQALHGPQKTSSVGAFSVNLQCMPSNRRVERQCKDSAGAFDLLGQSLAIDASCPFAQVSCLPHKLVGKGHWGEKVLLGLADDVDCAVVSLSIRPGAPTSPLLSHDASIPALSYVSAGDSGLPHRRSFFLVPHSLVLVAPPAEDPRMWKKFT